MLGSTVRQPGDVVGDLTRCDAEPIHIPGSIQPHGVLLALSEDGVVLQASENVEPFAGRSAEDVVGQSLAQIVGDEMAQALESAWNRSAARRRPMWLGRWKAGRQNVRWDAVAHRADGTIVLELEWADGAAEEPAGWESHLRIDAFTLRIEGATSVAEMSRMLCEEVRALTGFDRVLVYRFDQNWHGEVIGEDGTGRLPSYLYHRFPASDIPAQARELYRLNRVRIIPDARYEPVPLVPSVHPATGVPLDMSFCVLRSVSPIHVEYMKNMDTAASMSISILREGQLWGLISCHHHEPRNVPFPVRAIGDLFARAFTLRLSALERTDEYEQRIAVRSGYSQLLAVMADRGDFAAALSDAPELLLNFTRAQGVAVVTDAQCRCHGCCPTDAQIQGLVEWLFHTVGEDVYATDSLAAVYPPAQEFKERASGLLAIAVSKLHPSFVIWFRPEVIQTIQWGGDPAKPASTNGDPMRLHPRRSFATWRETVRDRSLPWGPSEVEGAAELRMAIVGIVLRRAEELAMLNAELMRSNKELEAFSYSVSHDLRAPLRHIVGYAEMIRENAADRLTERDERCLRTIIESSEYAGQLVDKLLGYSRLGRSQLQRSRVDMNVLVEELRADVMRDAAERQIVWRIGPLPTVSADLMMLRMALRDLISNALKFTRSRAEAVIEIGSAEEAAEHVVWVKDNGVGFDMQYADKLFGVFQRLHRWEDYEGTGIGLANVRRVLERHGGRTWAEGQEGHGATFFFTLPKRLD